MRGTLEKMRADAAKMQDENARAVAMGNIELWQMQLDTMQRNLDANREAMQKRNEMMKHHQKPASEDQEKPTPK
jgi:gas vesicle protein